MARGATLETVLAAMRIEAGLNSAPSLNTSAREEHIYILQREQRRLSRDFDWPHLRVERFLPLAAGQRFYDLAEVQNADGEVKGDLDFDRLTKVEVKDGGLWLTLVAGINAGHLSVYDSALDERADPAQAWRVYEGEQIEVWPVPETNAGADQEGYLRFTGFRNLRAFAASDDVADLDEDMLALYGAAALVGRETPKGQGLLQTAQDIYTRLGHGAQGVKQFGLFAATRPRPRFDRLFINRYVDPEG